MVDTGTAAAHSQEARSQHRGKGGTGARAGDLARFARSVEGPQNRSLSGSAHGQAEVLEGSDAHVQ